MSASTSPVVSWDVDEPSWAEALAKCPGATYFHTAAWLTAAAETFRSQIVRVRADFDDGRFALLPLSVRPLARGLVPLAVSGETGVYGGLVSNSPLSDVQVEAVYAAVARRFPNLQVMGNPFATGPHLFPSAAGATMSAESTHLLQLAPFDDLRKGFNRGAKSRGNKARRYGFTLDLLIQPEAVDAFYPLYQDSVKRWGDKLTWPRPREFFERMLAHGAPGVSFLVARDGKVPVSALMMAAYGPYVHYIAGATHVDYLDHSPSNFLMEEALAHFARGGFAVFDFGPSNGLAGVAQFKESFGAHPVPFHSISRRTLTGKAYFALRSPLERLGRWQRGRRDAAPHVA